MPFRKKRWRPTRRRRCPGPLGSARDSGIESKRTFPLYPIDQCNFWLAGSLANVAGGGIVERFFPPPAQRASNSWHRTCLGTGTRVPGADGVFRGRDSCVGSRWAQCRCIKSDYPRKFDMSLGTGLSKLADKVFRIGNLGHFNDLMLAGTLAGVEMGLGLSGVPHKEGGVMAALHSLARTSEPVASRA